MSGANAHIAGDLRDQQNRHLPTHTVELLLGKALPAIDARGCVKWNAIGAKTIGASEQAQRKSEDDDLSVSPSLRDRLRMVEGLSLA